MVLKKTFSSKPIIESQFHLRKSDRTGPQSFWLAIQNAVYLKAEFQSQIFGSHSEARERFEYPHSNLIFCFALRM